MRTALLRVEKKMMESNSGIYRKQHMSKANKGTAKKNQGKQYTKGSKSPLGTDAMKRNENDQPGPPELARYAYFLLPVCLAASAKTV